MAPPSRAIKSDSPDARHDQHKERDRALQKARNGAAKRTQDGAPRVPCELPPFTVSELRRAIPPHCFQRSYVKSFAYLLVDLSVVALLFLLSQTIDSYITKEAFGALAPLLRYVLWTAYWIAQGCAMTGLWVIGHECGHGGFAESAFVCDVVGFVVHSCLLVPYFSWKISHRRHHSNTGSIERDEVFVPALRAEVDIDNTLMWSAPVRCLHIVLTLTIGWFLYLLCNATGRKYPSRPDGTQPWVNHFSPSSPIFSPKERNLVLLSDAGLLAALGGVVYFSWAYSFSEVLHVYIIPYFIVNFWLVLITLLQHTDAVLPHYSGTEWDWLRGALATVDRDYGILNHVFHHIGDTHVCHHLFSSLPHYHAQEATEVLKLILGRYYRFDGTPIAVALWKCFGSCHFVEEERAGSGILWYGKVPQTPSEADIKKVD